ncbi:glycosyl hydrolase family 18 protein [Ramlibacter tataouinensis]|uniref:glycosyl hydrolase family 18 protein n=1 Tax=Ramlibacter tataouinensis TaxID=94132 RepID=UPI0002E5F1E2|nr:glycosyl hydrolase family 18 protein [Ramlibacter tataouinensis]
MAPAFAQSSAAAAGAGLPAKVLACYFTTWDTSRLKIDEVPTDFNVIYLFHAKPNGSPVNGSHNNVGDGSFFFEYHANVTPGQVQACRDRGQKVILTAGGAQAGYAWDNRAKSQNFVNSFRRMHDSLGGLDGLDFNNFEAAILNDGNVQAVTQEMVWIAQQLKSLYGPAFAITAPPQPNDPRQQQLMAGLQDAGVLTYCGAQFYDWSGFNAPGYIKQRTDAWISMLGDERSFVVGLSGNYPNGPSLQDCIREWDSIKAAHPDIRGMFCWSAQHVAAGGNAWSSAMKARL